MVREFHFDEKELKCEKEELMKLASDKKQQYVSSMWFDEVDAHNITVCA